MVAHFHRLFPFLFLVSLFVVGIFANDVDADLVNDMRIKASDDVAQRYVNANLKYKHHRSSYPPSHIPDFHQTAWELAHSQGVIPLETVKPVVGYERNLLGLSKKEVYGPKQTWFYSVIQPWTVLARGMRLVDLTGSGKHQAAIVL